VPHKNKTVTVNQRISGHEPQMGFDTKTYWLTDRQLQCNFDFDLNPMPGGITGPPWSWGI
jgi:hypothetical protein